VHALYAGFQIVHALGGGTGGLTSYLLQKIEEEYSTKKKKLTFAVTPSSKVKSDM
jgi:hypothetical protein